MRRTAALIAGGGPAGAAAAITLAQAGTRALVIERSTGPHDLVCGGFLGWDALGRIAALGLDTAALRAHPITRVRLVAGGRVAEADLPHPAAGLSRMTLDEALRTRALALGAGIDRGVAIRRVDPVARSLDLADGATLIADVLFLATGKHEVRGAARPRDPAAAVGLKRRLTPSPALACALAGRVELHLFRGGYAGLLLQEDGAANLCLSIAAGRLAEAGGIDPLLAMLAAESPRLAERLAEAGGPWLSIANVPYGWRATQGTAGVFRVGDQAAVIASLAGDGVAIALSSGMQAGQALLAGGAAAAAGWQSDFAAYARRPLRSAGLLKRVAEAGPFAGPLVALLRHLPQAAALFARATRIDREGA